MVILPESVPAAASLDVPMLFEEFYRSHADRVHRALALTVGDHHLAKEATDEAMARAYLHWRRVRTYDNPGAWVYRVGLNWTISWWRRFGRERPVADPLPVAQPSTSEAELAHELLATLPPHHRAVVVCRLFLGLSTAETAAALGIAEGTVRSRLSRSVDMLRRTHKTMEDL